MECYEILHRQNDKNHSTRSVLACLPCRVPFSIESIHLERQMAGETSNWKKIHAHIRRCRHKLGEVTTKRVVVLLIRRTVDVWIVSCLQHRCHSTNWLWAILAFCCVETAAVYFMVTGGLIKEANSFTCRLYESRKGFIPRLPTSQATSHSVLAALWSEALVTDLFLSLRWLTHQFCHFNHSKHPVFDCFLRTGLLKKQLMNQQLCTLLIGAYWLITMYRRRD